MALSMWRVDEVLFPSFGVYILHIVVVLIDTFIYKIIYLRNYLKNNNILD